MKRLIKNQFFALIMVMSVVMAQVLFAATDPKKLAQKVESAIGNYYLETFNVKADVSGKIVISGDVNSLFDRIRIYEIVTSVPGVIFIENKLNVNTEMVPDKIILENIRNELSRSSSILEPDRIKVNVTNGFVFLTGDVSYYREKIMAETVASWQQGVKGIENEINVLPSQKAVSDDNLKIVLQEILKNHFGIDKTVTFIVQNGVVNLNGKTNTMWDKKKVEEEFSHVLGIKKVINNLEVAPVGW
jgi:osmotically-inducible protein OsmY